MEEKEKIEVKDNQELQKEVMRRGIELYRNGFEDGLKGMRDYLLGLLNKMPDKELNKVLVQSILVAGVDNLKPLLEEKYKEALKKNDLE